MLAVCRGVVVFLILFLWCSMAYAKPAPPEALTEILGELSEVEERFESENWQGARESLEEVVELYIEVKTSYTEVIPDGLSSDYLATANKLDQLLEAKDEESAENSYIHLQVVLFDIMSYFEYSVHPVIGVLKKYIGDEAKEALEENNLEEVHSELKEVVTFVTKNASLLQQRGVKHEDIQSFLKSTGVAMQQVKAKDNAAVKITLESLEAQIDGFQKSFS